MAHEMTRVTRAALPTAVVAEATTWHAFPALWPALLDEVRAAGVDRRALNVMLYRDDVPNVEVGVLAESPFVPSGRAVASCLPAGDVAMTAHRGPYEDLGVAHRACSAGARSGAWSSQACAGRSTGTTQTTLRRG